MLHTDALRGSTRSLVRRRREFPDLTAYIFCVTFSRRYALNPREVAEAFRAWTPIYLFSWSVSSTVFTDALTGSFLGYRARVGAHGGFIDLREARAFVDR